MSQFRGCNVLIVHGIGWGGGRQYARPLEQSISAAFERALRRLKLADVPRRKARAKSALRFEAVSWASVTQDSQNALLSLLGFGGVPLLRRFSVTYQARRQMVGLLGDVIAYESGSDNRVYRAIHGRVDDAVRALSEASTADQDAAGYAPLTVIGHSLGSVIASDYVWDHTRGAEPPHYLPEHRLALRNMIIMGSPMALYALRNNPGADKETLAASLSAPVRVDPDGGLWLNLYDPQDPIAFPLRPIRAYAQAGLIDCRIRAGNWLTTWNPASHVGYWRSSDVAEFIGRKLALDWAAMTSPRYAETRFDRDLAALRKALRDH